MNRTTLTLALALAILAGIMGIEHGIGEVLEGNRPTEGIFILSWPNAPFFEIMSGEPAMTIIPNYFFTGILAILFSITFLMVLLRYRLARKSIPVQAGLLVLMLLTGGGFGPPILGTIAVLIALKGDSQLSTWRKLPLKLHRVFSKLWPWVFGVCLAGWLMLFPGAALVSYFAGVDSALIMIIPILVAFGLIPITLILGFSRDILLREQEPQRL
jgi:hypothetical protein